MTRYRIGGEITVLAYYDIELDDDEQAIAYIEGDFGDAEDDLYHGEHYDVSEVELISLFRADEDATDGWVEI